MWSWAVPCGLPPTTLGCQGRKKDGGAAQGVPVEPMPESLPVTTDIRAGPDIFTVHSNRKVALWV